MSASPISSPLLCVFPLCVSASLRLCVHLPTAPPLAAPAASFCPGRGSEGKPDGGRGCVRGARGGVWGKPLGARWGLPRAPPHPSLYDRNFLRQITHRFCRR